MSNYNALKTTINANIKQNGVQAIKGTTLNAVLNEMVTTLGAGYQFAGIATPSTNPGTPDAKVFYIAGPGVYNNFGNTQTVTEGSFAIFAYDGTWHSQECKVGRIMDIVNTLEMSESVNVDVDFGDYQPANGVIGAPGNFNPNSTAKFIVVDVPQGAEYMEIGGTSLHITRYAFLKASMPTTIKSDVQMLDFYCAGTTTYTQIDAQDTNIVVDVPSDALYVWVFYSSTSGDDRLPRYMRFTSTSYSERLGRMENLIANNSNEIASEKQKLTIIDNKITVPITIGSTAISAGVSTPYFVGWFDVGNDCLISSLKIKDIHVSSAPRLVRMLVAHYDGTNWVARKIISANLAENTTMAKFAPTLVLQGERLYVEGKNSTSASILASVSNVDDEEAKYFLSSAVEGSTARTYADTYIHYVPDVEIIVLQYAEIGKRALEGLTWFAIGDSLTDKNTLGSEVKNYTNYVAEKLGLIMTNKGVAGTGYWRATDTKDPFWKRVADFTETEKPQIITVFGSFNDLGGGGASIMGTADDIGTSTLGGCINTTIDNICTFAPDAMIGLITPTQWLGYYGDQNANTYCQLIRDIGKKRGIPVLDLFVCSNLRPYDETFVATYYKEAAGVHPNTLGHKRISGMISDFLIRIADGLI